MSLSLTFKEMKLLGAWTIVLLAGCVASPSVRTPSSPLVLSDTIIASNKGDIEGLYKSWIAPHRTHEFHGYRYIPHSNKEDLFATEAAIKDGFARFCSASGGNFTHKTEQYGDIYNCSAPQGVFIGELSTQRYKGNLLRVIFDSPRQVKLRAAEKQAFNERKSQNGPTGVIVTNEGRFRFLRIGNLKERHVIEVELDNKSEEYVPIEEIAKIEFHEKCCEMDILLRDGRIKTINTIKLIRRLSPSATSTYGYDGLPIVLMDPESGQPYTRRFPNIEGIREIIFDHPSLWKQKPSDVIETKFDVFSPHRMEEYTKKLRIEANRLYVEAETNGWIKLLPENGKLTPRLKEHLEYELSRIAKNCGNAVDGITSLEEALRCKIAGHEYNLVIGGGYSLVTDVTPLSSIIVLRKIKYDLKN